MLVFLLATHHLMAKKRQTIISLLGISVGVAFFHGHFSLDAR